MSPGARPTILWGGVHTLTNTVTNPLVFTNTYVGATGRLQSIAYPNGQTTTYSYFPNAGDHRLQEIWHKASGGATLSKFDNTDDAVGNIQTWTQQTDGNPPKAYDLGYDTANQLTAATFRTTDPTPTILKRYVYGYDPAGNRIGEQQDDSILGATYNNMNQLTSQQPGGALRFKGTPACAVAPAPSGSLSFHSSCHALLDLWSAALATDVWLPAAALSNPPPPPGFSASRGEIGSRQGTNPDDAKRPGLRQAGARGGHVERLRDCDRADGAGVRGRSRISAS